MIDANRLQPTVFAGSLLREETNDNSAEGAENTSQMLSMSPKRMILPKYDC